MPGRWKWYGGLLGSDGCIYGMPYYANSVLKIDPSNRQKSAGIELDTSSRQVCA